MNKIFTATVTEVVDGDTFDIEFPSGYEDRVRVLGVDTPEARGRENIDEYGIPDDAAGREYLRQRAALATDALRGMIGGKTVALETDSQEGPRGGYNRLLAYVYCGGQVVNRQLLLDGHARVYRSSFSLESRYLAYEKVAKANRLGIWGYEY